MLLYTQPLFTALMAAAAPGEVPSMLTLVSGALIVTGVWLVNRPNGRARRTADPGSSKPAAVSPE